MKSPNEMVRINNSIKVLDLLINKEMSRVDIAEETGLTKTTIGDIVKNFLNIGFIEEVKVSPNGVGRPSINLKIVKDFAHVIGVGILRDSVNGCLIDSSGKVLYNVDYPYIEGNPQINTVYKVIDELMRKAKLTNREVKVISFGVPGPLDTEKGIIKEPPKLPEFANFPLIKKIKEKYNVFAYLGNDADMGAIGEKYYGKGKDLDSFIYILYDKGIGAGIIIDNHLYHGVNGYAGEIGHTLLFKNEELKYFEDEYGIDRVIESIGETISKPIKNIQEIEVLSDQEKESIERFTEELSRYFASILLSLIHYFGISNIFIDGRMKYLGDEFFNQLLNFINKHMFHKHSINISFSDLDEYVISRGAAKFGLIKYLKDEVIRSS
ncbi:ArsR family transcriptional regulator [Petrotoga mexicana DSM 14811]|uniref:ArsR family transcriptional regulator n=1 Tax=Petrotoga mexicana DSM 14811 TaxID=1122954 RepID=A0A2K1PA38_9BACT|nr:ROK family transcriptional regulator [Petrotoga mexicana]PNR99673.1 ArsR family transcriptional regulator [Petrotoga mexicana DSM 14811]